MSTKETFQVFPINQPSPETNLRLSSKNRRKSLTGYQHSQNSSKREKSSMACLISGKIRNNSSTRRCRTNSSSRGILQVLILGPSSPGSHPNSVIKTGGENPRLSNTIGQCIADVGTPQSTDYVASSMSSPNTASRVTKMGHLGMGVGRFVG
jgi:hypothetical protein